MPRIPRSAIKAPGQCYHVFSRISGQQFLLGEVEQQYFLDLIRHLSQVFFVKVFSFCILSNHFHLVVQMQDGEAFSHGELQRRFRLYYGEKASFTEEQGKNCRRRWADLSEYMKQIKKRFSGWYNRRHNRQGALWSGRFESVVLEHDEALLQCMAYADLNAVRANLVERPETYRFCGLGYHVQSGNRGGFLSLELPEVYLQGETTVQAYRRYVYEEGGVARSDGKRQIPEAVLREEGVRDFRLDKVALLQHRCRYFTRSVAIGSRSFVRQFCNQMKPLLRGGRNREPVAVSISRDLYSLCRR